MSSYIEPMWRVMEGITQYRVEHFAEPTLIELSDADYDAIVAATWYDADAKTAEDAKHYDVSKFPREGATLYGVPARAESSFLTGRVRVS